MDGLEEATKDELASYDSFQQIAKEMIAKAELDMNGHIIAHNICFPVASIMRQNPEMYRWHVKELLHRLETGQDTREATNAEMLSVMIETSLVNPLNLNGYCIYYVLFKRFCLAMGVDIPSGVEEASEQRLQQATEEVIKEELSRLQLKLYQGWRTGSIKDISAKAFEKPHKGQEGL